MNGLAPVKGIVSEGSINVEPPYITCSVFGSFSVDDELRIEIDLIFPNAGRARRAWVRPIENRPMGPKGEESLI
ncbi:Protein with a possible role in tRNA export [Anopheles sinensis]|uniref:Protein with a possible role in tRNA export n=1 Tax=Anopheles sinensis TaxID=74873 RepID=A0A084VKG8_ANOSI|nr:Protein with a possible role in tRNA export [Anopheles sinensis]